MRTGAVAANLPECSCVLLGIADREADAFPVQRKPGRKHGAIRRVQFPYPGALGVGQVENRSLAEHELLAVGGPGSVAAGQIAHSDWRATSWRPRRNRQSPE